MKTRSDIVFKKKNLNLLYNVFKTFSNFNKHKNTNLTKPGLTSPTPYDLQNSGSWLTFNNSIINHSSLLFKIQIRMLLGRGMGGMESARRGEAAMEKN